ncbi:MAG: glycosyltransferase family 2 protein [Candidatus Woykebacteria bacterium]
MNTEKGNRKVNYFVESLPAYISWILLSSPFWAVFLAPRFIAFFIILFDIYFFWKAALLGINSIRGYLKIKQVSRDFWVKKMRGEKLDYSKVKHFIFIPTYKEPIEILDRTLTFLSEQELQTKQVSIVLATEKREEGVLEKAQNLKKRYSRHFDNFLITSHVLEGGEVVGKSSNLSFAAKETKSFVEQKGYDKNFILATSCDADVLLHPKYLSNLTYKFLKDPEKYLRFWQGALVFYNNIWRVPIFVRVVHTIYSINGIAELLRPGSNFNYSTYSLSWNLLEETNFWDADVVAEDWHLFFKAFFLHKGSVSLDSIFLPLFADAAEGSSYWKSLQAQYKQNRRWAWGVTDIGYAIREFWKRRAEISKINFFFRFARALEQHLLWPANWWLLTLGASIPPLINPAFRFTALGFYLPRISGFILTVCAIFIVCVIVVDWLLRPPRPEYFKKSFLPFTILQYILLPLTGLLFGALPGMDAHTRLILGKRLDYQVTEKISKK